MEQPYPGHAEDLRKRDNLAARIERGHAAVLPGALREAFAGDPVRISSGSAPASGADSGASPESFSLQPVTLGLAANLERIKSPLLEIVRIMRDVFSERNSDENSGLQDQNQRSTASPSPGGEGRGEGGLNSPEQKLRTIHTRLASLKFDDESIAETVFIFTRPQKRVRKLLDAGRDKFRETVMDELGDRLHPAQMAALQRACAQHYVQSFATIIGYGAPAPEDGAVVFPPPSPGAATGSVGG